MFKFDVRDNVRIINENECYVDDPKLVADHVKDLYLAACYCMSSQPCEDDIGQIILRWEDNGQNIYYVRVYEDDSCGTPSCYCYLMDEAGLEAYEPEIKVGDKVKIVNGGMVFDTYADWVVKHITDKNLLAHWAYGCRVCDRPGDAVAVYEVLHIAPHGGGYGPLAFIKGTDKCFLVAVDGLAKVKQETKQKKNSPIEF